MQALSIHAAKFTRPRVAQHVIERPAITARLREALRYPLTLVRAGAGYGKSTLISQALSDEFCDTVWVNLSEQERNPARLLLHIIYAVNGRYPDIGHQSLQALSWDERQGSPDPFGVAATFAQELRAGITQPLLIVLDDFQYISGSSEVLKLADVLISVLPETVHIVVSSREKVRLPGLAFRRARGEILQIGEDELSFKEREIRELFKKSYGLIIDEAVATGLAQRTEGWIMALHMLGERLKKGQAWDEALAALPQSMRELFEFLLQEYLAKQPESMRAFLTYTSFLQFLKAEDCDSILGITNSEEMLRDLEGKGFFTVPIGDGLYRYHHLFQEYLQKAARLSRQDLADFYRRAALYYKLNEMVPLAIDYLIGGGLYEEAGQLIRDNYQQLLTSGQQGELEHWLTALPSSVVNNNPELLLCRGEICRLAGDFGTALQLYELAERGFGDKTGRYLVTKAFALVYLDTVQPVLAEQYLNTALTLVDESGIQEKARLYQLMAENNINLGYAEKAAALYRQANELFLEDSRGDVEARMHLRTGRLATAKNILIKHDRRQERYQIPKSHREPPLLLSLINSFTGDIDDALNNAQEGLNSGRRLNAIFVQAVGYMRLGHAKQLQSWTNVEEAQACYQQALDISNNLGVERGKAEPLCGLCLLHGHHGNLDNAVRYGLEGLRVGQASRDDWMSAMLQLALAVAYYQNNFPDKAEEWVQGAESSFVRCGDSYLSAVAMFWRAKMLLEKGDKQAFREVMDVLLLRAQSHDYDFLFYKPTLLGLRDIQAATPLLLAAHREGVRQAYAGSLLTELGASTEIGHHPGYTLRVKTLGDFRIWRGLEEIKAKEWQRERAKRLFQYLLTNRNRLLHKEQIIEALWGEAGSDNDFKVALNALMTALEPGRNARTNSFYISKQHSAYGLNLAAGISLDVDEFESYVARGERILDKDPEQAIALFRLALNCYVGDYLPDCCYEDWSLEERERLLMQYITTAEKMAQMLYDRSEVEECISLCIRILGKDRCWETAYQLLMRCYHRQNNRSMLVRVFKQCRDSLQAELGVPPSGATSDLFRQLTGQT